MICPLAANVEPYQFLVPPAWKQVRVANILSGNYCQRKCVEPWVDAKFGDEEQGTVQVSATHKGVFGTIVPFVSQVSIGFLFVSKSTNIKLLKKYLEGKLKTSNRRPEGSYLSPFNPLVHSFSRTGLREHTYLNIFFIYDPLVHLFPYVRSKNLPHS